MPASSSSSVAVAIALRNGRFPAPGTSAKGRRPGRRTTIESIPHAPRPSQARSRLLTSTLPPIFRGLPSCTLTLPGAVRLTHQSAANKSSALNTRAPFFIGTPRDRASLQLLRSPSDPLQISFVQGVIRYSFRVHASVHSHRLLRLGPSFRFFSIGSYPILSLFSSSALATRCALCSRLSLLVTRLLLPERHQFSSPPTMPSQFCLCLEGKFDRRCASFSIHYFCHKQTSDKFQFPPQRQNVPLLPTTCFIPHSSIALLFLAPPHQP